MTSSNPRNLLYSLTAKTSTPNCVRAEVASGRSSNLIARLLGNGIIYEGRSFHESFLFRRLTVAVSKKIVDFSLCYLYRTHKKHTNQCSPRLCPVFFWKERFPSFRVEKKKKHTHTQRRTPNLLGWRSWIQVSTKKLCKFFFLSRNR